MPRFRLSRFRVQWRPGISLIEMLLAFAILVLTLVPLLELMIGTTKGTKITRDYLIGYNLAQLAFEQVMHAATVDAQGSFDSVVTQFSRPAGGAGPSGCPGVSISELAPGGALLPDDGNPAFNPTSGDPDYVNLYRRYTYTLTITPAPASADTVVAPGGKAMLARVDIQVFWKDHQGNCTNLKFSDYIARRRF